MATIDELKSKIRVLQKAGLPYDEELKQLGKFQEVSQPELPKVETGLVAEAKKIGAEVSEVEFKDIVDRDAFLSAAGFYPPSSTGIWKGNVLEVTSPISGKNQRWWIVETQDERLEKQGRGVLVCDLDKGAFKLQQVLTDLGIKYSLKGNMVSYKVKLPIACEIEWSERKDKKNILGVSNIYAAGKAPERVL